jgi:peptide/nickel transport system substrate-binding protein
MKHTTHGSRGVLNHFFYLIHNASIGDRLLVHILLATLLTSGLWFALDLNAFWAQSVSVPGGDITEGVIGEPRFVNPVLATTRADKDLTALIFSGIMRPDHTGALVPELAKTVERSEDGTTYTITLRSDMYFHDGTPVTADDVVFTYELIKNPAAKSPLRGNWENVSVQKQDPKVVTLTLEKPYTPFIHNLTVGILPEHLWANVPPNEIAFHSRNTHAVGTGPYQIDTITRTGNDRISAYTLQRFTQGETTPHLKRVVLRFFETTQKLLDALRDGTISGTADIPPERLSELDANRYTITTAPLPQTFGIFFNQNRNAALRDKAVRTALAQSINRERIVANATHGQAIPTRTPVPKGYSELKSIDSASSTKPVFNPEAATQTLKSAGWGKNENNIWRKETDDGEQTLSITIRTLNADDLSAAATEIARTWRALGAEVKIEEYEQSDLLNEIIRPREFEAVLFGMDVGRGIDLYPFWHSSQQTDPGLNIAQYANITADDHLETLRTSTTTDTRNTALEKFIKLIRKEHPAIFLYTPTMQYVTTSDINLSNIPALTGPHDRLKFITSWHRARESLWPIFHSSHAIEAINTRKNTDR